MAQCKDCIHNGLCKIYSDFIRNHDCELFVGKADVVPKSEVKCIYAYDGDVEEYCVQSPCPNYKTIEQAKQEVARDIFEDIRKTCGYSVAEHDGVVLYHTKCYSIMATKLDELEKKFVPDTNVGHKTESEGEHGRDSNIQSSS